MHRLRRAQPGPGSGRLRHRNRQGRVSLDAARLLSECRQRMPTYMVPAVIDVREGPLPRNPNGKIDRKVLSAEFDAKNKAKP